MPGLFGGGDGGGGDYTIKETLGGSVGVDLDLDNIRINNIAPLTVNSNLAVTQPIVSNSTSKSDSTASLDLKLEPLDVKIEPIDIKIEPLQINSDSNSAIDIKPLVVDSCQTIKLAPLPPICLESPYSLHFGVTFMGMELWGFNLSGRSETYLSSPPKSSAYPKVPAHGEAHKPENHSAPEAAPANPPTGLRVRVK